jgi:hypothetical protein
MKDALSPDLVRRRLALSMEVLEDKLANIKVLREQVSTPVLKYISLH